MVGGPGRDNRCDSVNQPMLGVIGLVMLVSSLAFTGSVTMAQETSAGSAPAVPSASLTVDSGDTAWILHLHRVGPSHDDAGISAVLWRPCPEQEHAGDNHA